MMNPLPGCHSWLPRLPAPWRSTPQHLLHRLPAVPSQRTLYDKKIPRLARSVHSHKAQTSALPGVVRLWSHRSLGCAPADRKDWRGLQNAAACHCCSQEGWGNVVLVVVVVVVDRQAHRQYSGIVNTSLITRCDVQADLKKRASLLAMDSVHGMVSSWQHTAACFDVCAQLW